MSEHKHTSGPLYARGRGIYKDIAVPGEAQPVDTLIGSAKAYIVPTSTCTTTADESQARANARLWAASPELLALAEAYERWEADLSLSDDATMPTHLWERLYEIKAMRKAAIAKAKGGAE